MFKTLLRYYTSKCVRYITLWNKFVNILILIILQYVNKYLITISLFIMRMKNKQRNCSVNNFEFILKIS